MRDGILSKFEMAELATDPAGTRRVADVRGDRRRPDRRRAGRAARRARAQGAAARLPLGQHHRGPDHPARGRAVGAARRSSRSCRTTPRSSLEKMGVEIRLNTLAVDMDHDSITVKGPDGVETIRTRTRIWAAGVQASPLAKMLAEKTGAETDRAGRRRRSTPTAACPATPRCSRSATWCSLNKLPGVAQPAMQEGKYVGKLIKARLHRCRRAPKPFKYFDKGTMATIGHKRRGRRRLRPEVHRLHRLPHVGVHPRAVPGRLGQPDRHAVHLGPGDLVLQEPRRTGSSPSSRPTRT